MKKVAVLLADGFEEAEAVVFVDILRRQKISVDVLSCSESLALSTCFATHISADFLLNDKATTMYDAVMLPGGPKGTDNLSKNKNVIDFLKRHIAKDKWICAICSSGAKVLAANNLLGTCKYTTGGNLEKNFTDGVFVDKKIVVDRNFISAKGLGVVFEFSFTVAHKLLEDIPESIDVSWQAEHIYFDHWDQNLTRKQ